MGIQERVIRARNSNHLECDEFDGDIDVVMAAGMSGEPVGSIFARIKAEFDEAHASVKREAPELFALDPSTPEGRRARVNLRFAATLRLGNLPQAKAEMIRLAFKVADRHRLDVGAEDMQAVAWQALSIWLDPACSACGGLGTTGGYSGPQQRCSQCRGTKIRRGYSGKTVDESLLIARLGDVLTEAMAAFHSATAARLW